MITVIAEIFCYIGFDLTIVNVVATDRFTQKLPRVNGAGIATVVTQSTTDV